MTTRKPCKTLGFFSFFKFWRANPSLEQIEDNESHSNRRYWEVTSQQFQIEEISLNLWYGRGMQI